ncbi:glycoside hydrolase family 3 C-terminal domain-containing protein, partial [candidate division KSB1 bacterium]|nr:glycoside hydrolase family 3 C-terminal domain-containing protein [candidate division KSB1 bacterium]
ISEAEIDTSVARLFTARMRLGMFDPPESVAYTSIPYSENDSREHDRLALEAARACMVLLKNDDNTLPLSKNLKTVAVIGPNADDVEVLLGNYNGTPSNPVTPLQGIRDKLGADRILYAPGCHWAENMPALSVVPAEVFFTDAGEFRQHGLNAAYYDNRDFAGKPLFTRIDAAIDFDWQGASPDPRMDGDNFAVRWSGVLIPPLTGDYELGGYGFNGFRIFLQDTLLLTFNGNHHPNKKYKNVHLEKDRPYRLKVEFFERSGDAHMQLIWSMPGQKLEEEAMQTAKRADAIILFLGLSPRLEGEEMNVPVAGFKGGDRLDLGLPRVQEQLMQKIVALGKPVALVLLSGSAVAVNWADEHVPAILQAWYPGQRAGTAIADVLFGDYNPGGRLPVTVYKSAKDLPPFEHYAMQGRTYRYFNSEPLYSFGYGLSYTLFAYSDLKLGKREITPGDSLRFEITVRNSGERAGDEVVQVYVTDEESSVPVPIRSLAGFRRVHLQPGEKTTLQFMLTPRQMSVIDADMKRVLEPGWFTLLVGGGQADTTNRQKQFSTGAVTTRFQVVGK